MPPMPGSISRGRFLQAIKDIANNTSLEGLMQIRESLVAGNQHVENLADLSGSMGTADIDHLASHWFSETPRGGQAPAAGERWWPDQPTSEIIRYGEIRGLDLIIAAKQANKRVYTDCVWCCRGDTVEVVNTQVEFEGVVFITFMVLTPPIPKVQQIADAASRYTVPEGLWVTTARENVTYDGRLLPGFRQDNRQPPQEAQSSVITVEMMTVADAAAQGW